MTLRAAAGISGNIAILQRITASFYYIGIIIPGWRIKNIIRERGVVFIGFDSPTNIVTGYINSCKRIFASAEIAVISLNVPMLRKQAEEGNKTAKAY